MSDLSIYSYMNYREFLGAYFELKKKTTPSFSFRNFSKKAGLSTSNYAQKIISKERSLGPDTTEKFIHALALKKKEADYFRKLIQLERTSNATQKLDVLTDIVKTQRKNKTIIFSEENDFYSNWVNSILYELAHFYHDDYSPQELFKKLKKQIPLDEIKNSLEFLFANQFLAVIDGGIRQNKDMPISSSQFKLNSYLRLNHKKMSELAVCAVDLPLEERSFQGLLLSIDHKRMPEMKARLKEMTEELLKEFSDDSQADTLYRFNLQVFPLS